MDTITDAASEAARTVLNVYVEDRCPTPTDTTPEALHEFIVKRSEQVMREAHCRRVAGLGLTFIQPDGKGIEAFLDRCDREIARYAEHPLRSTDPIATIDGQYEAAAWATLAREIRRAIAKATP